MKWHAISRSKFYYGMNCKLVLSSRSQFFHKRLFFSSQAKLRSTTQRLGMTLKVCSSLRLAICTVTFSERLTKQYHCLPELELAHLLVRLWQRYDLLAQAARLAIQRCMGKAASAFAG